MTKVVKIGTREYLRIGASFIAVEKIDRVNYTTDGGVTLFAYGERIDVSQAAAQEVREFLEQL